MPNFTDFLNIAGALGSAMIAFILPSLLYMKEFKGSIRMPVIVLNWAIVVIGAGGGTYSIYYSINKLINEK